MTRALISVFIVALLCQAWSVAAAPQVRTRQGRRAARIDLAQGWAIQSSSKAPQKGDEISTVGFDVHGWYPTSVPSTVIGALVSQKVDEMMGTAAGDQVLSRRVMRLEQLMTTGGGWQDQAGAVFPGAKLVATGPGLAQRLRVQPVPWSDHRAAEFERILVLYYTGIRRVARDLLRQVVGRYLARETTCLQVLHSIKTLAMEMAYAMREGDWDHLGSLLDRHWRLNQLLDPNTTNAPINALLDSVRPLVRGRNWPAPAVVGFSYCSHAVRRQPKNCGRVCVRTTRPVVAARFTIGGLRGKDCTPGLVPGSGRRRPAPGATITSD